MADNKTRPTGNSVLEVLTKVEPAQRRADGLRLHEIFAAESGEEGQVWSGNIIGYGSYDYKYASGREGTWMKVGFAVRKAALTLYLVSGVDRYSDMLAQLGKHSTGASCLYLKKLAEIDEEVLRKLIRQSLTDIDAGSIDYTHS